MDGSAVAQDGFFQGYNGWTWGAISCQAIGGLIVALVVKCVTVWIPCLFVLHISKRMVTFQICRQHLEGIRYFIIHHTI